jgi:hypothetical protein
MVSVHQESSPSLQLLSETAPPNIINTRIIGFTFHSSPYTSRDIKLPDRLSELSSWKLMACCMNTTENVIQRVNAFAFQALSVYLCILLYMFSVKNHILFQRVSRGVNKSCHVMALCKELSNKIHTHKTVLINGEYGVSKSFWTGSLEWELQMVQLSATGCSCITILWVSLVSFATITLCAASQQVFIVVYFVINSVHKLLDTPLYILKQKHLGGTLL